MKKLILAAFIAAAMFVPALSIYAEGAEYHYDFPLSCGQTIHRTFNHSLSQKEFLDWTDFFENEVCGGLTPGETEIH